MTQISYNLRFMTGKHFLAGFLCALVLLCAPTDGRAQIDLQDILDKAVQKLGGAAYMDVKDIEAHGRYFQFQRGELTGGDFFSDYVKFPDKERTEFGEDRKTARVNNGSEGWNINDKEVDDQLGEQIEVFWEEFRVSLDYLMRFVIGEEKTTLQYVGREIIDFKRVDILEIRNEDRTRINLFIDRESGLLMKKTMRRLDDPAIHEEVYSNYHEIQNVLTPLLINRYTDGMKTMEMRFDEVAYNTGIADRVFTPAVLRHTKN